MVRDADFSHEETQAIELYDRNGRFLRKLGSFGPGAGQYLRLSSATVAGDGTVWAADFMSKVMRYEPGGRLLGTTLVQNPGYNIKDLALDEPHGFLYLAGCLPKKVYLNLGCTLVHQYSLSPIHFLRSFLDTDPEAVRNNLLPLENLRVDADERGTVYAADAPIFKFYKIDPGSQKLEAVPIRTREAHPPGPLAEGRDRDYIDAAYRDAWLMDRLLVNGQFAMVSIRRPQMTGFILEIFTSDGQQVAEDLPSPGNLVGRGPLGVFYFVTKTDAGFKVTSYRVARVPDH